ncbi:PREDICTED: endo-1,3;1,4-beta-D-glucanase-like [Tarenaya hassleriana]|uniref:endo-1,3;1,4-beta-D-glucanase-like n=1 Tax=Tarenaya hassleriana TaxID=28532 RepID=UPI00053C671B|nr:PREDICTED: endo-1,3;1,4-beta-D-glucanase-like [Tarenaya hassleriana]
MRQFLSLVLLCFVLCPRRTISNPQCLENPPNLDPNSGSGHVTKIGGLKAYVSGSSHSKRGIILVSDVYGYEAPNLRKIADKVAAAGFYAVVPDYFFGDPYKIEYKEKRPVPVWIKDHPPAKGFNDSKPVIEALKRKGITTIGATGICWGAKVVVELAKTDLIQAAVFFHPSYVTVDDIKEVKAPLAIFGAEFDGGSPPALLKQFEQILAAKSDVKSCVKIFPNVKHGWTVRYNVTDPVAVKAAEEAHNDMLQWFATLLQ